MIENATYRYVFEISKFRLEKIQYFCFKYRYFEANIDIKCYIDIFSFVVH